MRSVHDFSSATTPGLTRWMGTESTVTTGETLLSLERSHPTELGPSGSDSLVTTGVREVKPTVSLYDRGGLVCFYGFFCFMT